MSSRKRRLFVAATILAGFAFTAYRWTNAATAQSESMPAPKRVETATFAGGCFWCMESPFEKLEGVVTAESGYTGGHVEDPTYEQVSHTETGHVEAVRITYDADRVSYNDLLEVFWRQIDPTDSGGQFVDRGTSYLSAIFVQNDGQRKLAEASKQKLIDSGRFEKPIVTPIRDAATFYLAEEYHQDFYKKSSLKYKYYRYRSGRDAFIDAAWGEQRNYEPKGNDQVKTQSFEKPSRVELKERLTDLQFRVTQEDATEPAFKNEFWDNKADGIYVDVVSGEPLFSSLDKYKSGTGWPSFSKPLVAENIVERTDYKLIWPRTEVRSKRGDSHLGHVFTDGPAPTGLRYCMNSASLRFIPTEKLTEEGYEAFKSLFEAK